MVSMSKGDADIKAQWKSLQDSISSDPAWDAVDAQEDGAAIVIISADRPHIILRASNAFVELVGTRSDTQKLFGLQFASIVEMNPGDYFEMRSTLCTVSSTAFPKDQQQRNNVILEKFLENASTPDQRAHAVVNITHVMGYLVPCTLQSFPVYGSIDEAESSTNTTNQTEQGDKKIKYLGLLLSPLSEKSSYDDICTID